MAKRAPAAVKDAAGAKRAKGASASENGDLKTRLAGLYEAFNVADAAEDPVQFLAGYDDPADREVVAFCAASLAFGRVASVKASISRVLDVLGPHPAAFPPQSPRRPSPAWRRSPGRSPA